MGNKPIETALGVISNRFLLATVVARRWENVVAGAPPLVETRSGDSKLELVLEEVIGECVTVDPETREIRLHGAPLVDDNQEALFSEPIGPEAAPSAPKGRER